tara:strand:- start:207 stop:413 length:207 start_codon:yes stop_codon:yes gene_type:complete
VVLLDLAVILAALTITLDRSMVQVAVAALVLSVVMVQTQVVVMVVMEHRFQQPSEIQQDQVLLETLSD